uniref:Uncharacterized protein n=1 Tax=Sipha flava TaxID=143950 RepID=A0A2S2R051_9HEMI
MVGFSAHARAARALRVLHAAAAEEGGVHARAIPTRGYRVPPPAAASGHRDPHRPPTPPQSSSHHRRRPRAHRSGSVRRRPERARKSSTAAAVPTDLVFPRIVPGRYTHSRARGGPAWPDPYRRRYNRVRRPLCACIGLISRGVCPSRSRTPPLPPRLRCRSTCLGFFRPTCVCTSAPVLPVRNDVMKTKKKKKRLLRRDEFGTFFHPAATGMFAKRFRPKQHAKS